MSEIPGLDRFFERLCETKSAKRAVQIAAFGDSVTQGAMELGRMSPHETYHRLLQQDLEDFFPACTINMANAGISGETASQAAARLERDVLRCQPDLVLVAFGLNDAAAGREKIPEFDAAIRSIVAGIREHTPAAVMLLTPPFIASSRTARIHPSHESVADLLIGIQTGGILADYAEALRRIAREERTLLADVHAEWARLHATGTDMNNWLANGLNHPDMRGHRLAKFAVWNSLFLHYSSSSPSPRDS